MDPYSQNSTPAGPQPDGRAAPYKFTADELRVFKECNRESFYQRSLPIGTFLGFGTYYATKAGFLKPSLKWGALPKVSLAVIFGYFVGKVSYQQKCVEKIMRLPNSPLADALRKRKQQYGESPLSVDPGLNMGPVPSTEMVADSFEVYSDKRRSSTELDFSQPMQSLDTTDSRHSDDVYHMEEPLPAATNTTTYGDLRAQNRDEFEKKRNSTQNRGILQPDPVGPQVSRSPSMGGQTNQYGDAWER